MEKRTVTRKDVAEKAGVSVSVVSRALNNSGYVREEKRKRILAAAEELGYYPNLVAMSLQKRRTRQILFFCEDLMNSYNIQMYQGMTRAARARGYMVVLNGSVDFSMLRETMVDGIIMPNERITEYYLDKIGKNYHLPVVTTSYGNSAYFPKAVPRVESDMYQVIDLAVAELRKKGHQRIALATPFGYPTADSRLLAWRAAMEPVLKNRLNQYLICLEKEQLEPDLKKRLEQAEEKEHASGTERGYNYFVRGELLAGLMKRKQTDATAVICFNDELAAGFCSELRSLGVKVPEQLSVMGIDGSYVRQFTRPLLSTISIEPEEQGAQCAEVLMDLLEGKKIRYVTRIPIRYLEGETVRELPE